MEPAMVPETDPGAAVTVAAVQMSSQEDVAQNLQTVDTLVTRAAQAGAKLVLLPECFAFMGPEAERARHAEPLDASDGPIQSALRRIAKREHITLIGGGFPERSEDPERPYNTSACFGPDGALLGAYRKIHLFDVDLRSHGSLCESRSTTPGKAPVALDAAGFRVGLAVCYDIRFPELFRKLVDEGAEILTLPAAFTLYTGKDHWHVMLRARAIESQCYLIAAAQWGKHPENRATFGHALIADPWGTVVAEASDRVGYALARVERDFIREIRGRIPALSHRRL
jgi:predicted amidohydrolase